ncbi:hypothetical protein [Nitrosomonas sp.]|uniref:hypothetical protein n=1 Tax=Nitrosomonas sp. TaxID=42353 RepID=UPI00261C4525|nr:hypothetical protein [Nitrosomonas sp.]MCW5602197.1 hypothetical protein [Nitrosomonas sp.]
MRQTRLESPAHVRFLGFHALRHMESQQALHGGAEKQGSRINKKLKEVGVRLAKLRTNGGRAMMDYAKRHLQGHIAYFGVSGNRRSLKTYIYRRYVSSTTISSPLRITQAGSRMV